MCAFKGGMFTNVSALAFLLHKATIEGVFGQYTQTDTHTHTHTHTYAKFTGV